MLTNVESYFGHLKNVFGRKNIGKGEVLVVNFGGQEEIKSRQNTFFGVLSAFLFKELISFQTFALK